MPAISLLAQAAQAAVQQDDIPKGVFIFVAIIIGGTVAMTSIIMGINHANKERELNHQQRIKALEHGINLDDVDDERRFRKALLRLAFAIGVVVPICAAGAATGALTGMGSNISGLAIFVICSGAASVGIAGVASGAWLAQSIMARFGPGSRQNSAASDKARDAYPRTYETVAPAVAR